MSMITCRDAAFSYEGKIVVGGLNFEVNSGDYLCIVGENGSGKSTLIKGLLKLKSPVQGSIAFEEGLKAGTIGYLPQQTPAQRDFPASAYEVVLSGRMGARGLRPFYSGEDKRIARENMERLHIENLSKQCYRQLSGGQQQRVLLARALCAAGRLLLLDEPVAGLDPKVTQELYHLIREINREMGITVIMVSHDIQSAVRYASHMLHLQSGQAFFGITQDYLRSDVGKSFVGLEEPKKEVEHL